MALYEVLRILHRGVVWRDPLFLNLLDQSDFLVVPVVNADGVAFIEQQHTADSMSIAKKRKNMNPKANMSSNGIACAPEDAGVDLNRNYPVDWGQSEKLSWNFDGKDKDECADPCSECYRGSKPFSEPETQAIRNLIQSEAKRLKFVVNFHSFGNMWIYPYNGRKENDIEKRSPGALAIF
jgi:carboxypeptidase T